MLGDPFSYHLHPILVVCESSLAWQWGQLFEMKLWSVPSPSEQKTSHSHSWCVCVFITLPVAARGWNSYYINTVKPPLPVFYLIEDILWRLYGNDRTCTVFLFYSDFVCVAEINPNLSPRLGMRMQERGKLPYKFIPGCREQRREWWCCD